ncbi:MAG TPA: DNA-directed RNA polymerase subunit omega [Candidatus Aphodoplasma excrementigallinarum]|uniref:DNA-directed RNA polymerase subunit omega n=1 Tax=Candidatus Aphodoplasma excrementigallinarum TaxID=2840673 RepID=A0A9D1NG56_9FIRM|nr:DNA-directed RNA polymerase subunit omega [Candidatus Aphodoplasma excrementigallinarum]
MIYPPISDLVKKTKTRYSLAILTARRARQLGADEGGEFAGKFDEAILEAIDEINEGKVTARPKNYYLDHIVSPEQEAIEKMEKALEEEHNAATE